MDETQTQETNSETIYLYSAGIKLDDDIIWKEGDAEIFLPKENAGIGAVILKKTKAEFGGEITQPQGIFIYGGQQYLIPLRYAYFDKKLHDFGSGLDAGIFLFPIIKPNTDGSLNVNEIGALLYLSKRTIHSQLVNLFLFDNGSDNFKLVHTESSEVVKGLNQQGAYFGEFVYYYGFQGPIKIWEMNYPEGIEINPEYLRTDFPNLAVRELNQDEI